MEDIRVDYNILDDDNRVEAGRKHLECYMFFEVEKDFWRKAWYVANSTNTPTLTSSTYPGVVSRKSIQIDFTLAALNGLNTMTANIQNTYP